ncbi:MAG: phosphoethanolamine transferase [Epsilonproteobacteria bacterium]|nr:phosphoethanolamine transferase [Campylobacterota bacterium]
MFKKFLLHLGWTFLVFVILFVPDVLYTLWKFPTYFTFVPESFFKQFAAIFFIIFFVLMIPQRRSRFAILTILALFSLAEQLHFVYYHNYISPYKIKLFFQEQEEIWQTVKEIYRYFFLPLFFFLVQLFLLHKIAKRPAPLEFRYALPISILLLAAGPIVAFTRNDAYVFMPKTTNVSIANMYTTLSWFLSHELFKPKKRVHFQPYRVEELPDIRSPQNIIVVMGESLGSNKMSLFGFDKNTTPNLDALKNDPRFLFGSGYACSVCTKVSLPTFFTLKAEPANIAPILDNTTNLARLAKARGYKVHYITMQNSMLLSGYISGYADSITELKGYDEKLIEALEKIDLSRKNFIILHQRNSHSPYHEYTPPRFYKFPFKERPYEEFMLFSYLNSVLYTDYILSSIFKKVKELDSSAIAFFTSDHGELIGIKEDKGKFGHSILDPNAAKVPFLIYYNDKVDPSIQKMVSTLPTIHTHYQFGKLIARTLGYAIVNPNENNESFYINGTDLAGENGYMVLYRNRQEYKIVH